jgi:hypothetical protein
MGEVETEYWLNCVKRVNMNETEKTNCDNQMYQQDLNKCCECKKPFTKGQEY